MSDAKSRRVRLVLPVAVMLMVVSLSPFAAPQDAWAQVEARFFPQTGKTARGAFLDYWNENGALDRQGYPISAELQERSDTDGKLYAVQYFERAVFEYHPLLKTVNKVQLSLLGVFLYKQKYPAGAQGQTPNKTPGSQLFTQTGKRAGGLFLQYWNKNGGLPQFGYPTSDEFREQSDLDGRTYVVQYYERAVFEMHPENKPPHNVLLSQLGTFRFRALHTTLPAPVYTAEEMDYFAEVALGSEFGEAEPLVSRWEKPLLIKVHGTPTATDRATLSDVIADVNGVLGVEKMALVQDESEANVNIHFVPNSQFSKILPSYVPGNEGYVSIYWDGRHRIYEGTVLITTQRITQRERSHLIREEVTQGLGLLKDSYKYPESIFYQVWTDTQEYAPIDEKVIEILHLPQIRPGMNEIEARAALNSLGR